MLNPTTCRISLLLHESEAELRTSVNNKEISYECGRVNPSALIYHVFYQNNVL